MTNKNDSRRKLLKSIAAGSGAVVAGKTLPDAWTKPVVDSVMLPAHAETTDETGSSPTGTIICASLDVGNGKQCQGKAISFYISGEVTASDGSSLEGVSLTVSYTNIADSAGETTVTFTVLVLAGNTFSSGELMAYPPAGDDWEQPEAIISVAFTDSATYGTSTCSTGYNCDDKK